MNGVSIVAVDSTEPDLDNGLIGRGRYEWIEERFGAHEAFLRIFVLHHHLLPVPGTGRERNVVHDAGDTLECLQRADVHLVLSGHKHVPYAWRLENLFVVNAGTVSTTRLRGKTKPCYNVIEAQAGAGHGVPQVPVPRAATRSSRSTRARTTTRRTSVCWARPRTVKKTVFVRRCEPRMRTRTPFLALCSCLLRRAARARGQRRDAVHRRDRLRPRPGRGQRGGGPRRVARGRGAADRLHYCRVPAGGSACDGESGVLPFPDSTPRRRQQHRRRTGLHPRGGQGRDRRLLLGSAAAAASPTGPSAGSPSTTARPSRSVTEVGDLGVSGQSGWYEPVNTGAGDRGRALPGDGQPDPAETADVDLATGGLFVYSPAAVYNATADRVVYAVNDLDTVKYAYRVGRATPPSASSTARQLAERPARCPARRATTDETHLSAGPTGIFLTYRYFIANDNRIGLRRFDTGTNTFSAPIVRRGPRPDRQQQPRLSAPLAGRRRAAALRVAHAPRRQPAALHALRRRRRHLHARGEPRREGDVHRPDRRGRAERRGLRGVEGDWQRLADPRGRDRPAAGAAGRRRARRRRSGRCRTPTRPDRGRLRHRRLDAHSRTGHLVHLHLERGRHGHADGAEAGEGPEGQGARQHKAQVRSADEAGASALCGGAPAARRRSGVCSASAAARPTSGSAGSGRPSRPGRTRSSSTVASPGARCAPAATAPCS